MMAARLGKHQCWILATMALSGVRPIGSDVWRPLTEVQVQRSMRSLVARGLVRLVDERVRHPYAKRYTITDAGRKLLAPHVKAEQAPQV
jgi:DNA-binding PadR family transcriptional regulator